MNARYGCTVLLARILAMGLTLLLIHIAVQLCNGLQVGRGGGQLDL